MEGLSHIPDFLRSTSILLQDTYLFSFTVIWLERFDVGTFQLKSN